MNQSLGPTNRSDFGLHGTIGTGQSNKADVLKIRRALQKTGHGRFPRKPATNVTPGLMEAIEGFQRDFSLKRDSVVESGGPTEGAIRIALTALDTGGERGFEAVRDHFDKRADAGLTFRPDPNDPIGARWRDREGALLTDDQAAQEARDKGGETRTAMMRRRDQMDRGQSKILEGGMGGGGMGLGTLGAAATLQAIMNQMFGNSPGEVSRPPQPGDISNPKRTMPLENPPQGSPPFPSEPPDEPPKNEGFDKQESRPTILVSPIPEEGKPQVEVFPDMSDELEQWLVLESRGTKDGQQKDVKVVIDEYYRAMEKYGFTLNHVGGGVRVRDEEEGDGKPGDKVKERVLQEKKGVNKGSRRSDIAFKNSKTEGVDDINVVDPLVDGVTPTARERRAVASIKKLKEDQRDRGDTETIGKSKGLDEAEYRLKVRFWAEELAKAKLERLRAVKRGTKKQ